MSDLAPVAPWCGLTPRRWQAEALPVALQSIRARERGVVSAIMGAGKSRIQAEICASGRGRVLLTVPTVALVEQMAATIGERCPDETGTYYTHAKETGKRITICCMPSVPALLADPSWPGPPALWICDEAHKSQSATILGAYETMAPKAAIAFTATPYRALPTEELSLWDREIYTYGVAEAMRDGVIVPFEQVAWDGDFAEINEVCAAMIASALAQDAGPGLANAISIEDAEQFAAKLCAAGIAAAAVHSRLSRDETATRIAQLREGTLQTIVHVNMLSEGVDLPWLRWLCMRRPVQSKVRFCQEVGRVLRAHPGKSKALLLDPHDLLGRFALSYEAILSGMAADKAPFSEELAEAERESDESGGIKPIRAATRLTVWRRYIRALHLAAVCAGVVDAKIIAKSWRPKPASEKQRAVVGKALAGLDRDTTIPPRHRAMLATIGAAVDQLTRGDASDLIGLCFAFRDARRARTDAWSRLVAQQSAEVEK